MISEYCREGLAMAHGISKTGDGALIQSGAVMWVAGAAICTSYILSTLPTPLYPLYQKTFHFSQIVLTIIYAVYVVGTVATMFFFGRLSDQVGRRSVVLISLGIAAAGALVFVFAQSTWWLFPARILSGLGIALVSGAATAWITESEPDEDKAAATQLAIGANFLGLGIGPLMAGALAQYSVWPLSLSYVVFLIALVPVTLVVWKTEETVSRRRSLGKVSLAPRLGVPREIVGKFVPAAIAAFATFAVLGFYTALVPTLLEKALQNKNHAVAGVVVAELFFIGTIAIAVTPRLRPHRGLLVALCALLPSLGLVVAAETARSMSILLIGTAISGVATGLGYRCSLQKVNESAPDDQRSEVVSAYLVACYAGISLPVIGIGIVAGKTGPAVADAIFALVIALLVIFALIVEWRQKQRKSTSG
jgi:MFS family permease